MMSGHCGTPQSLHPEESHARCGGGNTWNPDKEFQPCPCPCHLGEDLFECANCGGTLREAPLWPNENEPGEMVYTHVDTQTGRAIGEDCLR
jgi:hypothetical protein